MVHREYITCDAEEGCKNKIRLSLVKPRNWKLDVPRKVLGAWTGTPVMLNFDLCPKHRQSKVRGEL